MPSSILDALSLVGAGGAIIIAATLTTLIVGVAANLYLRARYARLQRDLEQTRDGATFSHRVLNRILEDAREARRRSHEVNTQVIVEDRFQSELRSLLFAERFVRSSTGLVIILGLLGTFYGLTSSVGQLVGLVSGDVDVGSDASQSVTQGLTHALSGMSVAFSNSLFGILAAVLLTILGIISNVTDRRHAVMIQVENHIDRLLAREFQASAPAGGASVGGRADALSHIVEGFDKAVQRLENAVADFDGALQKFATSTRDFREFNLHLKDNVQRMSLSFGDFSETLKNEIGALKGGRPT
jgi:methyl-accepting chemotaxis protein